MPGKKNLQGAEIQERGGEVFFHPVLRLALSLNRTDQRAAVDDGNIELFHVCKDKIQSIVDSQ
jgi:hypothetical protein